jgi:peptidoglycan/LPS O-acetylase OafA/YrhL
MQQAAVALAIVLTVICAWWTFDYVRRRSRSRRRHR